MDDDYERILLIKQECFVYKLPPRPSMKGYRAADWGLDKPQWTGRMRITCKSDKVDIKLEDSSGQLFASAPVEKFPGVAVEAVTDSSRYFVLRIADGMGRTAFIGCGFADRGDAFDFNVALQDHFNREKAVTKLEDLPAQPKLDLGLKAGQTISIKLGNSAVKPRAKPKTGGGAIGLLPPPPGGAVPLLKPPQQSTTVVQQQQAPATDTSDEWGQFASSSSSSAGKNWVQF